MASYYNIHISSQGLDPSVSICSVDITIAESVVTDVSSLAAAYVNSELNSSSAHIAGTESPRVPIIRADGIETGCAKEAKHTEQAVNYTDTSLVTQLVQINDPTPIPPPNAFKSTSTSPVPSDTSCTSSYCKMANESDASSLFKTYYSCSTTSYYSTPESSCRPESDLLSMDSDDTGSDHIELDQGCQSAAIHDVGSFPTDAKTLEFMKKLSLAVGTGNHGIRNDNINNHFVIFGEKSANQDESFKIDICDTC